MLTIILIMLSFFDARAEIPKKNEEPKKKTNKQEDATSEAVSSREARRGTAAARNGTEPVSLTSLCFVSRLLVWVSSCKILFLLCVACRAPQASDDIRS